MNITRIWQAEPVAASVLAVSHRVPTAASLHQAAFAFLLAAEALLFLLSVNDVRASFALLNSAARCWPGRIGFHQ
jgi:hypothetical protein